jgi:hypothetical protein
MDVTVVVSLTVVVVVMVAIVPPAPLVEMVTVAEPEVTVMLDVTVDGGGQLPPDEPKDPPRGPQAVNVAYRAQAEVS